MYEVYQTLLTIIAQGKNRAPSTLKRKRVDSIAIAQPECVSFAQERGKS
jgi:hypothetical protein